jgi:hypothetical protein
MMLNEELKAKWIAALRSGEYTQIKGVLRGANGEGHCCLGVLCEVAEMKLVRVGEDCHFNSVLDAEGAERGYEPIVKMIGEANVSKLWPMNDCEEKSFAEIADYIEKHL